MIVNYRFLTMICRANVFFNGGGVAGKEGLTCVGEDSKKKARWHLNKSIELLKEKGKLYNSDLPTRAEVSE